MDKETWDTHMQTVRLNADKAPPFYRRVRNWKIMNIEGDTLGSAFEENRLYLADLSSHITTVPVLHHSFCHLLVASLLVMWIFAVFRRFERDLKPNRTRVLAPWHAFTITTTALGIGALFDWLGLTMTMVAACIAYLENPWDALGMLVLLTLASEGWTTAAIGLTAAYLAWTHKEWENLRVYLFFVYAYSVALHEERNDLGDTPIELLWWSAALVVPGVLFAAWRLRTWDQVTLWDGAVLEGVQFWDAYVVSRPQYGPALSGQAPVLGWG